MGFLREKLFPFVAFPHLSPVFDAAGASLVTAYAQLRNGGKTFHARTIEESKGPIVVPGILYGNPGDTITLSLTERGGISLQKRTDISSVTLVGSATYEILPSAIIPGIAGLLLSTAGIMGLSRIQQNSLS